MSKSVKQHKVVRLTEEQFHELLSESIENVLNQMITEGGVGFLAKIGGFLGKQALKKATSQGGDRKIPNWHGTEEEGGPHKGGILGYAIDRLVHGRGHEKFEDLAISNRDRENRNKAKTHYEAGQKNTSMKFDDYWKSLNNGSSSSGSSGSSSGNSSSSSGGNFSSTNNVQVNYSS